MVYENVIMSVMCVGVRCAKTPCCFVIKFYNGGRSKFDVFHPNFVPPLIHTKIPTKNVIWMPKTQGQREFDILGAPVFYLEVRIIPRERVDPWKYEDRPSPGVKVCYHQGRYGVEIMIESLFRDRTVSWVRIVNGIHKYVTERSEEILDASVENRGTGKLVAKARPRPTPTSTLSPVSIPCRERKWIDVEPGKFSQSCFEVSKFMIRLLRHGASVPREADGAVRFGDLAELFKSRFAGASNWSVEAWISFLAEGGGPKKRFQYCLNPNSSEHFLYFQTIQGHFRRYSR